MGTKLLLAYFLIVLLAAASGCGNDTSQPTAPTPREPGATKPDSTGPKATEPASTGPETTEPKATELEMVEPEEVEPAPPPTLKQ